MIQVTERGLVADRDTIAIRREQFGRSRFAELPQLLEPPLLGRILDVLDHGTWDRYVHDGIGVDEISRSAVLTILRFLSNDPKFLAMMGDITGCGPFTWFGGRVYRMLAQADHQDSWHGDVENGPVAMSINLSPRGYHGGRFQLRKRRSTQLLVDFANTGAGDAILFATANDLEHQVTPVEPGEPKVAFAGWFAAGPSSLHDRLKETRVSG
jgi:hypothetical protein